MSAVESLQRRDRGWSWVVLAACFSLNFFFVGFCRVFGVFFINILSIYNVDRQVASRPFAVAWSMHNLIGPIAGILGRRYGIRETTLVGVMIACFGTSICYCLSDVVWMAVIFGGMFGAGFGLVIIQIQVVINQYFEKLRATASGIQFAGSGFGAFALSMVIEKITETYGFRGSFLIMGGMLLHGLVAALLLRPFVTKSKSENSPESKQPQSKPDSKFQTPEIKISYVTVYEKQTNYAASCPNNEDMTKLPPFLKEVEVSSHQKEMKTPRRTLKIFNGITKQLQEFKGILSTHIFILVCLTSMHTFFTYFIFVTVIVDFAYDKRIPENYALFLPATFSFGDILGRLFLGWIADRKIMKRRTFIMLQLVGVGVAVGFLPVVNSAVLMLICSAIYGLATGTIISLICVLLADYMSMELVPVALGLTNFFTGLTNLSASSVIGYFRDTAGYYDPLFYILSAAAIFCAFLWLLEPRLRWQQPRELRT